MKVPGQRVPGSREYRVSEAAGVGHPAGQGSGGIAVVVLVFAPVAVVFAATALELREEASREGSCCDHGASGRPQEGALCWQGTGQFMMQLILLPGAEAAPEQEAVRSQHCPGSRAAQEPVSTRHWRAMQA